MKNTINKQTESLKNQIDGAAQKSKEGIKSIIESSSKQFEAAMEANTKAFNSISKMLYENEMDPSIISGVKSAFIKGIELSEDAIDTIIDSYTSQSDMSADFTKKFTAIIKSDDYGTKKGAEKLVELVKENLDKANELAMNNMKKIVSAYNGNINLALNFNRKFADNINAQITTLFTLQHKNTGMFTGIDMVTEWWKNIGEEKHHKV
ncbi:MAG TPA: hypothetical protein VK890_12545 [Bacteroidia bacterium]|jgi:hypothetical protein|nr:hypothetical protein [Bacteroidia bacterium]